VPHWVPTFYLILLQHTNTSHKFFGLKIVAKQHQIWKKKVKSI